MGFHPIGEVTQGGMAIVDAWYKGYGEGAPRGNGPDQSRLQLEGNAYVRADFPQMSMIESITLVDD